MQCNFSDLHILLLNISAASIFPCLYRPVWTFKAEAPSRGYAQAVACTDILGGKCSGGKKGHFFAPVEHLIIV